MSELAGLWDRVVTTVQDPTANLTAAVVLLAAAVLAVLIGLILLLAWILSLGGGEGEAEGEAAGPSSLAQADAARRRAWSAPLLAGVMLAALIGSGVGYVRSAQTDACLSCHAADSAPVAAWRSSEHSATPCWRCHGGSGALGGATARLAYLRWARPGLRADDPLARASVANGACERCHPEPGRVDDGDLRMSHAEPLAAGYECVLCHSGVAHGERAEEERGPSRMALCLGCHDGRKASARCETCHLDDVSRAAGTPPERFPRVVMGPPEDCRGCHSIESCNDCHGLEMPHPREFARTGAHAREAGFEGRATCEKCHDVPGFCNKCHKFGEAHEGPAWRVAHGAEARRDGGPPCRSCHNRSADFCALCHGKTG